MIPKETISYIQDSFLSGASAGGTMELLDDVQYLDNPTEDMGMKIFVSIFSAFVVPAIRKWILKRKAKREAKRLAKGYSYKHITDI